VDTGWLLGKGQEPNYRLGRPSIFCQQEVVFLFLNEQRYGDAPFFLIKDGLTFLNEQKSNKKLIGGIVDSVLVKGYRSCVALSF